MTKKKTAAPKKQSIPSSHSHRHSEGNCVDLLRQLSAYIDDELPSDICMEIRRHLGACPNCEVFIASLQHTVTLCRHRPVPQLTLADRMNMRRAIFDAANAR
ncbi:MAG TPA: zf-HC2 domain-containing protein [Nitrospiraceae bacterium]|nr:zf-HC2 domain-containing protein [Nitrospiraceae bacterium]